MVIALLLFNKSRTRVKQTAPLLAGTDVCSHLLAPLTVSGFLFDLTALIKQATTFRESYRCGSRDLTSDKGWSQSLPLGLGVGLHCPVLDSELSLVKMISL